MHGYSGGVAKRRLFRAAKGGQLWLLNSYVQGGRSSGGV